MAALYQLADGLHQGAVFVFFAGLLAGAGLGVAQVLPAALGLVQAQGQLKFLQVAAGHRELGRVVHAAVAGHHEGRIRRAEDAVGAADLGKGVGLVLHLAQVVYQHNANFAFRRKLLQDAHILVVGLVGVYCLAGGAAHPLQRVDDHQPAAGVDVQVVGQLVQQAVLQIQRAGCQRKAVGRTLALQHTVHAVLQAALVVLQCQVEAVGFIRRHVQKLLSGRNRKAKVQHQPAFAVLGRGHQQRQTLGQQALHHPLDGLELLVLQVFGRDGHDAVWRCIVLFFLLRRGQKVQRFHRVGLAHAGRRGQLVVVAAGDVRLGDDGAGLVKQLALQNAVRAVFTFLRGFCGKRQKIQQVFAILGHRQLAQGLGKFGKLLVRADEVRLLRRPGGGVPAKLLGQMLNGSQVFALRQIFFQQQALTPLSCSR